MNYTPVALQNSVSRSDCNDAAVSGLKAKLPGVVRNAACPRCNRSCLTLAPTLLMRVNIR